MNKKGVTLIELLLGISLMAVVLVSATFVLQAGLNVWNESSQRGELVQIARVTITRIIDEVKYGGNIVTARNRLIEFDTINLIDSDGEIERIKYVKIGNNIYRSVRNMDTELDYGTAYKVSEYVKRFRGDIKNKSSLSVEIDFEKDSEIFKIRGRGKLRNYGMEDFQ